MTDKRKYLHTGKAILRMLTGMAVFFLSCFFSVGNVFADGSVPADYKQTVYDQEDGLGSTEVNCMLQTASGYVWIGTEGGLYRYNGSSFLLYHLMDTEKQDIFYINALFQDSAGRLWVCTNNYGLFYISGSKVVHFDADYYNGVKSVNGAAEDKSGKIYIATGYGVYTADPEEKRLNRIEELAGHNIQGLTYSGGKIWGIYSGNKIFTISGRGTVVESPADRISEEEYSCISSDDAGTVYIGTKGRQILRMTTFYNTEILDSGVDGINRVCPYPDRVFVCGESGMGYFDAAGVFTVIRDTDPDSYISDMMIDYEGDYWFSSSRMGVLFLENGKFTDLNVLDHFPEAVTNAVAFYEGNTLIGTDSGLIWLDSTGKSISNALTEYLQNYAVHDIEADGEGNLWISTQRRNGLIRCTKDFQITAWGRQQGLVSNLVNCSLLLRNGGIAAGTEDGISVLDASGNVLKNYTYENGLDYPDILCLYEDEEGTLYAGSDGGGLYRIRENGLPERFTVNDGLTSDVVSSLEPGNSGIWIGTNNGVSYLDETIRPVGNIDFSDNIYDLIVKDGEVYIISSKGVLFTSEEKLLGTEALKERYYNMGDGLSKTFTLHSRCALSDAGVLYLCCNEGVSLLDTKHLRKNEIPPKLTVSSVDVDGTVYYYDQLGGGLTVPAGAQRIAISFSVLSYVNRENLEVRYKLEGFDQNTELLGGTDAMQAVYTNLNGGTYTLSVSAVNGDGAVSDQAISFRIIKRSRFLERRGVRITLLILTAGILACGVILLLKLQRKFAGKNREYEDLARRHAAVVKNNTVRTDYLANMSNEIKIPVNAMISTAAGIEKNTETDASQKKSLHEIISKGQDILNRVDETIKLARLESGSEEVVREPYSITTLVCDISDRMLKSLEEKPVSFLVDIGENIPDIMIGDFDKIKNILDIILDNARKFTKEGSVTFSVDAYPYRDRKADVNLVFSVSDTGIGIPEERLEHIFEVSYPDEERKGPEGINLAIARNLAEIMHGELYAESTYGAGSTFTLSLVQSLPERNVYPAPVNRMAALRVSPEEADRMWAPEVKALLVDDDELSRNVSLQMFHDMEIQCDTASTGVSALDMVMSRDYDIVFLDISMPVMNGVDILREIRNLSDPGYQDLPVIAMSEDALGKTESDLMAAGFSEVVLKPFDKVTFAGILTRFIPGNKIKFRTNDVTQYIRESRYSEGLTALNERLDVIGILDRIGGSIDVYNRMLTTFYNQNTDAVSDLRNRFGANFRAFRNRIHILRTGCQNVGAAATADILLRIENALNIGNKGYVRDNLGQLLQSLEKDLGLIRQYLDFVADQQGVSDAEYAAKHEMQEQSPEEAIPGEALRNLQQSLQEGNLEKAEELFRQLDGGKYVTEDREFLDALKDGLKENNRDLCMDLIDTYLSLKSGEPESVSQED